MKHLFGIQQIYAGVVACILGHPVATEQRQGCHNLHGWDTNSKDGKLGNGQAATDPLPSGRASALPPMRKLNGNGLVAPVIVSKPLISVPKLGRARWKRAVGQAVATRSDGNRTNLRTSLDGQNDLQLCPPLHFATWNVAPDWASLFSQTPNWH